MLGFVYLPGSPKDQLTHVISHLKKSGIEVCQFFHKKITHLITSNRCIDMEKRERSTSKQLLTDPSSRGALILSRATKKEKKISILEKAKNFGVKITSIDEVELDSLLREKKTASTLPRQSNLEGTNGNVEMPSEVKVRTLREPFMKVVDRSQCYRPLILEMKEWPDALTMFSQGANVLDAEMERKRRITFCELCNESFSDLQTHLNSHKHTKNASNPKTWEGVDALISKMPTMV